MADVSQLEVNGTTYNICDATARDSLSHVLELVYPIGSVYINASDSTNPATLLGFGTWERVGTGRVMIDANSTYAAGSTGGSATHTHTTGDCTLTAAQSGVPAHSHGNTIAAKTPSLSHSSITQPAFNTPELTHSVTQPTVKYTAPKSHTHNLSANGWALITGSSYIAMKYKSLSTNWTGNFGVGSGMSSDKDGRTHADVTILGGATDSASAAGTSNGTSASVSGCAVAEHSAAACSRTTNVAVSAHAAADCTMSGSVSNNTAAAATSAHNHGNTGSGSTIQPWVGVYMWKRTA